MSENAYEAGRSEIILELTRAYPGSPWRVRENGEDVSSIESNIYYPRIARAFDCRIENYEDEGYEVVRYDGVGEKGKKLRVQLIRYEGKWR